MSSKQTAVDRRGWPSGPWDEEPDREQWRTAAGLPALYVRNDFGALCGYVGLPAGHPALALDLEASEDVSVHGGITFGLRGGGAICHVPEPGEPDDVRWVGFDCCHAGDWYPGRCVVGGKRYSDVKQSVREVYRTVAFVRAECERLAAQLAGL